MEDYSSSSTGPPVSMHVLIVDDDLFSLKVLQRMLQRCQYKVTACTTVATALQLIRQNKDCFDIVMSDVYMPDADGFKLLEIVGLELDLPVIMMSANGETSVVMKGITHGACDYLIKPIRMEELRTIWQHVVRRRNKSIGFLKDVEQEDTQMDVQSGEEARIYGSDQEESSTRKFRVHWSAELHERFLMAVSKLGVNEASPKKILEIMDAPDLTREHVASHLQKYRRTVKRLSGIASGTETVPRWQTSGHVDKGFGDLERPRSEVLSPNKSSAFGLGPDDPGTLWKAVSTDPTGVTSLSATRAAHVPAYFSPKHQKMVANRAQIFGSLGLWQGGESRFSPGRVSAPYGGGRSHAGRPNFSNTNLLLGGEGSEGLYRMGSLDIGLLMQIQKEEEEEIEQQRRQQQEFSDAIYAMYDLAATFTSKGMVECSSKQQSHQYQAEQARKASIHQPTTRTRIRSPHHHVEIEHSSPAAASMYPFGEGDPGPSPSWRKHDWGAMTQLAEPYTGPLLSPSSTSFVLSPSASSTSAISFEPPSHETSARSSKYIRSPADLLMEDN